jgi:hypothetical protein
MLVDDLGAQNHRTFPFFFPVDLAVVQVAQSHGDSSAFPLAFLYSLLAAAWSHVTGMPHISLALRDQSKTRSEAISGKLDELILQIRRQVFLRESESAYQRGSIIGGSAIIKGELAEEWHTKATLSAGHDAEVRHYIADLKKAISDSLKCERIVALCDEANLLPEEWQKKLIGGHIRELSDLGIQFVFVAGYIEQLKPVNLPEYFDSFMELKGIPKREFREFLGKHFQGEIEKLSMSALNTIYTFTNGNPRISLEVVAQAIELATRSKRTSVRLGDAAAAIKQAQKRLDAFAASIPARES